MTDPHHARRAAAFGRPRSSTDNPMFPDWADIAPGEGTVELPHLGAYQSYRQSAASWARHNGYNFDWRRDNELLHVQFTPVYPALRLVDNDDPTTHPLYGPGVVATPHATHHPLTNPLYEFSKPGV